MTSYTPNEKLTIMCLALPFTNINSLNTHTYAKALLLLLPDVTDEENEEQRGLVIYPRAHI